MRLMHLSDLHLGKKLNEAPLIGDQRAILAQIAEIAKTEQPDAVLIAGDVYDRPVPSAEAVGLLDDFLTLLAQGGFPVVLISGNHDSAERLAFGARLFAESRVYLSPAMDASHAEITPLRFSDAWGPVNVWPVPFVKPAHVRAAWPDAPTGTYTEALATLVAAMPLNPAERNILMCHQYLTGGQRSDSEDAPVGGLDNVDADVFSAFDYVALGHLHRAQSVGKETVRYCGSPLQYSFSEVGNEKSVTLVELGAKGDVRVHALPLTPERRLRALRGTYAELTLKKNYEGTPREDYLHITLTDEEDVPDALSKLQVIYKNLLKLDYDNARTRQNRELETPEAAALRSPVELLSDFYALQNNRPMGPEQCRYARETMEKIWGERL